MKTILLVASFFCLAGFVCPVSVAQAQSKNLSHYHIIDSVALGGEGGWDYCIVDSASERLYTSRGTRTQVIDLDKKSVVGEIPNTNGVHGIAIVPRLNKGYTSNGRDSSVTAFDLTKLNVLNTVRIDGQNPDAILYDPASDRVMTFNGRSSNATVLDVETDQILATIPLSGKPEFAVFDGTGHVYVNIEDKSEITDIDANSLKVVRSWKLAPGEEPSGLAIDRANRLLFSVCSNKMMAISNIDSGRVIATVPIGEGVDAAAFDPDHMLAFSSNGEGTMTVVKEESPTKFSVMGKVPTRRGARTMALDYKTHKIYMVTAKFGLPPAPTADRPRPRPSILPGSVTLYVIGE